MYFLNLKLNARKLKFNTKGWALPHHLSHRAPVRNRIFGAELMVRNRLRKKGAEWRVRNHQNNFRTSAPTENYFYLNGNNVSFLY